MGCSLSENTFLIRQKRGFGPGFRCDVLDLSRAGRRVGLHPAAHTLRLKVPR